MPRLRSTCGGENARPPRMSDAVCAFEAIAVLLLHALQYEHHLRARRIHATLGQVKPAEVDGAAGIGPLPTSVSQLPIDEARRAFYISPQG
jgi:hypothetical protein